MAFPPLEPEESFKYNWANLNDSREVEKVPKCLFESAYKMAKTGRELIDDQRQTEAKQLLTEYMAGNVKVMLKTVREMLAGASTSNTRR